MKGILAILLFIALINYCFSDCTASKQLKNKCLANRKGTLCKWTLLFPFKRVCNCECEK